MSFKLRVFRDRSVLTIMYLPHPPKLKRLDCSIWSEQTSMGEQEVFTNEGIYKQGTPLITVLFQAPLTRCVGILTLQ